MKKDIVLIVVALVVSFLLHYWLLPVLGYSVASVEGQSMEPTLRSGDLLLFRRDSNPEVGDIIVYEKSPGILIVHRIVSEIGDEIVTKGDNNRAPDPVFEKEKIVGKVILVIPRFIHKIVYILGIIGIVLILIPERRKRGGETR